MQRCNSGATPPSVQSPFDSPPRVVCRHQVFPQMALWRRGQPGLGLLEVEPKVRRPAMRVERRLVPVDFVEVEAVRIAAVLADVEAQTPRLILLRMFGVVARDLEELREVLGLYLKSYKQNHHRSPPPVRYRLRCTARQSKVP